MSSTTILRSSSLLQAVGNQVSFIMFRNFRACSCSMSIAMLRLLSCGAELNWTRYRSIVWLSLNSSYFRCCIICSCGIEYSIIGCSVNDCCVIDCSIISSSLVTSCLTVSNLVHSPELDPCIFDHDIEFCSDHFVYQNLGRYILVACSFAIADWQRQLVL